MIQLQVLGVQTAAPANGNVSSPAGGSLLIRGVITDPVQIGGFDVWSEWDGELFDGKGVLHTGVTGRTIDFEMTTGELYIRSATVHATASAAYLAAPVPVVIKKGTVVAGSVGTHWFVWVDSSGSPPTTWFVLLKHPTEPLGRVEVADRAEKSTSAFISVESHYLELPNHLLPANAVQRPLDKKSVLYAKVQAAIKRAVWQTA